MKCMAHSRSESKMPVRTGSPTGSTACLSEGLWWRGSAHTNCASSDCLSHHLCHTGPHSSPFGRIASWSPCSHTYEWIKNSQSGAIGDLPKFEIDLHVVLVEVFAQNTSVPLDALLFKGCLNLDSLTWVALDVFVTALIAPTTETPSWHLIKK